MEDETTSLWNKKSGELTVGDSVKVAIGVTVLTTAAAVVTAMAVGTLSAWAKKFKERRDSTSEVINEEG